MRSSEYVPGGTPAGNFDNLTCRSIISVIHGDDESITALTGDGIDELTQMLSAARRSPESWSDFLDDFGFLSDAETQSPASKAKSSR
ncbi:hypothetical protein [Rhizobium gallicum]|uniref:hypothetical protein n=1 Tax=Rhizobium gallicum TaxID=56730 RepID=UPI001EF7EA48|nr:hypothetical protein [Rhizobium gallicum]ULJ74295.1 hypothetical protein L2W42_23090 [Rhizobium gallicum]